jgi:hypothetical protein
MKYYKDPNNNTVFAYESDGSQDDIIPANFVAIDDAEADSLRNSQAESLFDKLPYSEKRLSKYPDFRDYLDGIVKGDQEQINAYIAACQAVKAKYPKS